MKIEPCAFCEIVAGTRPTDIVWSNKHCVAFASLGKRAGRLLVVPKQHCESIGMASPELLANLLGSMPELAELTSAKGYRVQMNCGANTQTVRHLHAHFIYGDK